MSRNLSMVKKFDNALNRLQCKITFSFFSEYTITENKEWMESKV